MEWTYYIKISFLNLFNAKTLNIIDFFYNANITSITISLKHPYILYEYFYIKQKYTDNILSFNKLIDNIFTKNATLPVFFL